MSDIDLLSQHDCRPRHRGGCPAGRAPHPAGRRALGLPHFQRKMCCLAVRSRPDADRFCPVAAAPECRSGPSRAEPGAADPRAGKRVPSALRPAHRAGSGTVSRRAFRNALPCPGRDLPGGGRADGAPCRRAGHLGAGAQSAGLRAAVRALRRRQRRPCPAPAGGRRHRGHPQELRRALRRGRAERAARRLQEPPRPGLYGSAGRLAGAVPHQRPHRSRHASAAPPGVHAGCHRQPLRFLGGQLPLPRLQKKRPANLPRSGGRWPVGAHCPSFRPSSSGWNRNCLFNFSASAGRGSGRP